MKIGNIVILLIAIVIIGISTSFIYFTTFKEAIKPDVEKIIKHTLNLKKDDGGFGNINENKSDILISYFATSILKNLNALDDNNKKSIKDYLLNELNKILNSNFNKNEELNISIIIMTYSAG